MGGMHSEFDAYIKYLPYEIRIVSVALFLLALSAWSALLFCCTTEAMYGRLCVAWPLGSGKVAADMARLPIDA